MFNPKEEIKIDPFALDTECLDQGRKVLEMADLYSIAVESRDRAKLSVEVIHAQEALRVRRNPSNYELKDKPSDAVVNSVVTIQPRYIRARQRLIRLNRDCEMLKPGVDGFKDRSIQIGRLINLLLSGYLGGKVNLPEEGEAAVDKMRTEHHKELLNKNPRLQALKRGNTNADRP
jgi:hypothetical protein